VKNILKVIPTRWRQRPAGIEITSLSPSVYIIPSGTGPQYSILSRFFWCILYASLPPCMYIARLLPCRDAYLSRCGVDDVLSRHRVQQRPCSLEHYCCLSLSVYVLNGTAVGRCEYCVYVLLWVLICDALCNKHANGTFNWRLLSFSSRLSLTDERFFTMQCSLHHVPRS